MFGKRVSTEITENGYKVVMRKDKREIYCKNLSGFDAQLMFNINTSKSAWYETTIFYLRDNKNILKINEYDKKNLIILSSILPEEVDLVAKYIDNKVFVTVHANNEVKGLDLTLRKLSKSINLRIFANKYFRDIGKTYFLNQLTSLTLTYSARNKNNFNLKLLRSMKYLPCLRQYHRYETSKRDKFRFVGCYVGNKNKNESNLLSLYGFAWLRVVSITAEFHRLKKVEAKYLFSEISRVKNMKIFTVYPYNIFNNNLMKKANKYLS